MEKKDAQVSGSSMSRQSSQDKVSQSSTKDRFASLGRVSTTSVRLRPSDGTADVSIGITPKPKIQNDITKPVISTPGGSITKSSLSRRESNQSSMSSISIKSRSILSGEGAEKAPTLEGNLQIQSNFDCGEKVISVLHTPDGNSVVGGLMNGSIKVFNIGGGNLNGVLENEETISEAMPISRIKCKPGGDNPLIAATYVSGHLRIWNHANGTCVGQVQDDNKDAEYLCLSYNPFADVIAVGLDNGHIKLYDERTLQVTSLLKRSLSPSKVDGHTDRVFCIANHPYNPHEFVSSGWDNTLQVWDARSPHAVRSIYGVFVCGDGLAFDRRGKELMVAHWRPWKNLQFLDYATCGVLAEVEPDPQYPHYLTSAQYLGKDYVVATGTDKSIVRVIDRHSLNVLATIKDTGPVYDVDVQTKSQLTGNKFVITNRAAIASIDFNK